MSDCFDCLSAKPPFGCPISSRALVPKYPKFLSTLRVPLECPCVLQVPFERPRVKNICNITGNGLVHEFLKKFWEYIYCIILIADCFLRNKMCKFYYVLQARYNHSKVFPKTFFEFFFFFKFQKIKYIASRVLLLLKLYYYNVCSVQFYYCRYRITESGATIFRGTLNGWFWIFCSKWCF